MIIYKMAPLYINISDVGRPLWVITKNVGRPLVGLQGSRNKNLLFRIGEPQGPSLHFLTSEP